VNYTAKGTASLLVPVGSLLQDATGSWVPIFAVAIAFDFVTAVYPKRAADPAYLLDLQNDPIDSAVHKELIACEYYERRCSYVQYLLISPDPSLDTSSSVAYRAATAPVFGPTRLVRGCPVSENF